MTRCLSLLLLSVGLFTASTLLSDTTQDLIRLEQQMTDALVRSDAQIVETLWSDDLVWIGLNGKPSSKAERLASMKATTEPSSATVLSVKNNEMKVRVYGDTAVVTVLSAWTTRSANIDSKTDYMATHVWRKQRGKWKLVSAHISRLTP